jgi:hypothetical protein
MPDDQTTPQRGDEEDHDLLTFGEAGARLHEELVVQQRLIERLRAQGASKELDQGLARLAALQDAARRNKRQPITDANFESFFGGRNNSGRSCKKADQGTG